MLKCPKCGFTVDRDDAIESFPNCPECGTPFKIATMVTIADMYSLDWRQILYKAVQSRPTSWRVDNPVGEYRNASDCIAQQVIQEMKNKGFIKEK